jgi:hypothetical protein
MGIITDNLPSEIREAMKGGDKIRLSTLRLLSSALSYEKIAQQRELTQVEEMAVVRSEAKKRKDAMEAYGKAGSPERAELEKQELEILQTYLPPEMGEEELMKLVEAAIVEFKASLPPDASPQAIQAGMGKVIGAVAGKANGTADGRRISEIVKTKLSGSAQ